MHEGKSAYDLMVELEQYEAQPNCHTEAKAVYKMLFAIPADAPEQIAKLKAEVAKFRSGSERCSHKMRITEESFACERGRRISAEQEATIARREKGDMRKERDAAREQAGKLVEALARIKKEGPVQRYGANVPQRLVQWVLAVREEAGDAISKHRESKK